MVAGAGYNHDVLVMGGGLAGATLGKSLAEAGIDVLIVEREVAFRDRVRGEEMHCWGVAEARKLGIHDLLLSGCAHEARYWSIQAVGAPPNPVRDLFETTSYACGSLGFYHPKMQEVLLNAAAAAGATVRRGEVVTGIEPGEAPGVKVRANGGEYLYRARLVVGADGRDARSRAMAGFRVHRDAEGMHIAGVLMDGLAAPQDTVCLFINSAIGQVALTIPIGAGQIRAYVAYFGQADRPILSGDRAVPDFVAASIAAGAPAAWFEGAAPVSLLACFDGADHWVDHPYHDGVELIGDAAAVTDPTFGCGLSLSLRDARVLRDSLLANGDWTMAAHSYAAEHDLYYGAIHRLTTWMRTLLYDQGPGSAALRQRALPRLAEDPTRGPDFVGLGPEFPSDEAARRRLFAED